jgi:hypothetical protein
VQGCVLTEALYQFRVSTPEIRLFPHLGTPQTIMSHGGGCAELLEKDLIVLEANIYFENWTYQSTSPRGKKISHQDGILRLLFSFLF